MPRERSPNRDKAFEIYKEHKGNIDLIEIAKTLGVSDGTVRGCKNKDKWEDKLNGTFQKKDKKNTISWNVDMECSKCLMVCSYFKEENLEKLKMIQLHIS